MIFSFVVSENLTFPTMGSSMGRVMTIFPRGKWAMVPPRVSCSIVKTRSLWCSAARDAENPLGPAPTMMTSNRFPWPIPDSLRIDSIACRPCSTALPISPMPPSSPAMKMPGTFVSKFDWTLGMSTPRSSVPNTSWIALVGHAVLQAPWPMHCEASTRTAFPWMRPRTACSGQAVTQEPQPIHKFSSMRG